MCSKEIKTGLSAELKSQIITNHFKSFPFIFVFM
uniref:Uncharacterized protein n=1 Tax=Tetranychus urticae TaxID=32264 RepID=T1KU44_TETUR